MCFQGPRQCVFRGLDSVFGLKVEVKIKYCQPVPCNMLVSALSRQSTNIVAFLGEKI